jgi:hypothetical protein
MESPTGICDLPAFLSDDIGNDQHHQDLRTPIKQSPRISTKTTISLSSLSEKDSTDVAASRNLLFDSFFSPSHTGSGGDSNNNTMRCRVAQAKPSATPQRSNISSNTQPIGRRCPGSLDATSSNSRAQTTPLSLNGKHHTPLPFNMNHHSAGRQHHRPQHRSLPTCIARGNKTRSMRQRIFSPSGVLLLINIIFWSYMVMVIQLMRKTNSNNNTLRGGGGNHWLSVAIGADNNPVYEPSSYEYDQLKKSTYVYRRHHQPPPLQSMTLRDAIDFQLEPLKLVDYNYYTVRINTFRRNDQLLMSINHYAQCEGVAEIQVVWCDSENDPPRSVERHPSNKVVIERHDVNTLNERFNVLRRPSTLGILNVDDDVLRACEAVDSGFFRWVRSPERMVGFDSRSHDITPEGWKVR